MLNENSNDWLFGIDIKIAVLPINIPKMNMLEKL